MNSQLIESEAIQRAVDFVTSHPGLDAVELAAAGLDASDNCLYLADRAGRIIWRKGAWYPCGSSKTATVVSQLKQELYRAAIEADKAFHAALVRAFGTNAGDRRYDVDESDWTQECRIACWHYQTATAEWLAVVQAERMGEPIRMVCKNTIG